MATRRGARWLKGLAVLGGTVLAAAQDAGTWRQELSLNGAWEAGVTRDPVAAGPAAWEAVTVPHLRQGQARGGSDFLWYRRQVTVPAAWAGGRTVLLLVGARYQPRVCVDGTTVAERLEGWTPFEVDLTEHVRPGVPFTLAVRCQDWGATFADGFTLPPDVTGDLRDAPKAKLIAPIGGHFSWFGLWDDAVLLRRPATSLCDLAILPSVRQSALTVRGAVQPGTPGLRVSAEVLDGDRPVLTLPAVDTLPDGRWELRAGFAKARFWSPEDPHLYRLQVTLADVAGKTLDRFAERFGFRELWSDGQDFVLNGVRRHLLASSGWPVPQSQSPEEIRANIARLRSSGCVAFRLHTQPWQRRWLDAADEGGLMIVEEGALWCDGAGSYHYADRRFWDNTWTHLSGMVRRDRNHASLVMWSIENEILHCGAARYDPECEAKLADLGQRVKELDPGHLITYEADLDPKGVADVIGLHYPHEMPEHHDYPNTADWLGTAVATGTGGGLLGSRGAKFTWDRRKPLYIGEFLWVPHNDYSPGSVFFGDEAYLDRQRYKLLSQAESWVHQSIAYRRAGVSGMCPWTCAGSGGRANPADVLFLAQVQAYVPVAIYRRDLQTRFFAGDRAPLRFDVFNDSVRPQALSVAIQLAGQEVPFLEPFDLPPAGHREVAFELAVPVAAGRGAVPLLARLLASGSEVHRATAELSISPREPLSLPAGVTWLVLDPAGEWCQQLGTQGYRRLASLAGLAAAEAARTGLIVAPGALGAAPAPAAGRAVVGAESAERALLRAFLLAGGRALVLEQEHLDGLSLGVELVSHPSTMVFPTATDHPLLAGLSAADLRFWAGDHYVSRREVRRPASGGGQALLVSGGADSLAQAALVDCPYGAGRVIFCQALVGTKLGAEPAARRLFANAVAVLARPVIPPRQALLLADGPEAAAFRQALDEVRLDAVPVAGALTAAAAGSAGTVVVHGGGARIAASVAGLRACLEAGGSVYWHAPDAETFAAGREALGAGRLEVVPGQGPLMVRDPWQREFAGVCLEDLAFAGPVRGEAWKRDFSLDPAVVDRLFVPGLAATGQRRYEAEGMALEGAYVRAAADGRSVVFASAGKGTLAATVPQAGLYGMTVVAGGTSAQGGWPQVAVSWNGKVVALVGLTGGPTASYGTIADLPAGDGQLGVAFVNDLQTDDEDRNLTLDAVLIDEQPLAAERTRFLALPPATVVVAAGTRGGRLVLDGVRWDTAGGNRVRGRRYASALLRNLGAGFLPPEREGAWIGPDHFSPVGDIPHYGQDTNRVALAAAGTVKAAFECATAGTYEILVKGYSIPAEGEYARAAVRVDDAAAGEVVVASRTSAVFLVGKVTLAAGAHTLTVEYTNDLWKPPEDRNLYLQAVRFRPVDRP